MVHSICGADCTACPTRTSCGGCAETGGRPFGGECLLAVCCHSRGRTSCGGCAPCVLKAQLIKEFNALGIEDMDEVADLHPLQGAFVNLAYPLPNGQEAKLLDDGKIYLGNQLHKKGSERCYGLAASGRHLLVCEYGGGGSDPEIVVYKRRKP